MKQPPIAVLLALFLAALPAVALAKAGLEVQTVKHRVTGLFSHEREDDFRETVKKIPDLTLVGIDFDSAEVTFSYDPAKLFAKGTKEKDYVEHFDNLLRKASTHTFGARALCATPKEKLTRVEIGVIGLDCKGCGLAAYEVLYKIDGVEQATANFKEGRMTALIDPEKTNRAALVEALKKRNVGIKTP
jgi:copper chaperone CopZ